MMQSFYQSFYSTPLARPDYSAYDGYAEVASLPSATCSHSIRPKHQEEVIDGHSSSTVQLPPARPLALTSREDTFSTSASFYGKATAPPPQAEVREVAMSGRGKGGALASVSFKEWLLSMDSSGTLLRYRGTLEEHFDSVGQIVKSYRMQTKGGLALDLQFFADAGICERDHRIVFARWFLSSHGLQPFGLQDYERCLGQSDAAKHREEPTLQRPSTAPRSAGALDLRAVSFGAWLRLLDPSGGLIEYTDALEDSYDTVAQVVRTYTLCDRSGCKSLDPQFFEDMNVTHQQHRLAFEAWFLSYAGDGS